MKIALIVIVFLLALIGWFKRDTVPFYVTVIVVVLLASVLIFQIIVEIKETKEKEKTKYAGIIKPKTKILLSSEDNVYPKLELGDGGTVFVYAGKEGEPMFQIFKDSHITILIEDDQLKVSSIIRNKNGIIAELIKNEWKINPNNSFDRNYSQNALEVKDNTGDIVFQVKHVGDRIQFQGKFYDVNGNAVGIGKDRSGRGGVITFRPELELRIEPIFKYPSDLHLGELNN
jgi:hypothetical protein